MQKMGGLFALSLFPHCGCPKSSSVFGSRREDSCLWERRFHPEDSEGPSRMTCAKGKERGAQVGLAGQVAVTE